jgi:hypothetical protein
MNTRLTPETELTEILAEVFLNNTDKVTKIGDHSVLRAFFAGGAKIGRKALKDVALVESHILPDSAVEEHLDQVAKNHGVAPRFTASGSSTYVRLVGAEGTEYLPTLNLIQGTSGQTFTLENATVIGPAGYTYAKVRSQQVGAVTNVAPLSLTRVVPAPVGHQMVTNEYRATGGRDDEEDDVFRVRIQEDENKHSSSTLGKVEQTFNKINPDVLRVFYRGLNQTGQVILAIATQNGIDLSAAELEDLRERGKGAFAFTDSTPFGYKHYGVELQNVPYYGLDISLRVKLAENVDPKAVLQEMQIRMGKYLDFRFWEADRKVEWDDLLQIAKGTPGVLYVPDTFFTPRVDVKIPVGSLPRVRGFLLLDTEGALLTTDAGGLDPVFYPAVADFSYQQSVLRTIH